MLPVLSRKVVEGKQRGFLLATYGAHRVLAEAVDVLPLMLAAAELPDKLRP
jgi:hypothetical protein